MEKLKLKHKGLCESLDTLERAVENYSKILRKHESLSFMDHIEITESLRDSLIQRFEFTFDLFWKYLKIYLENIVKTTSPINGPRPVIRTACNANILTSKDTEAALEMLDKRNLTSHIYKEEVADQISKEIPKYYKLMKKYADNLDITN